MSGDDVDTAVLQYAPGDFYRVLIREKQGEPPKDSKEEEMRKHMKAFLEKEFQTTEIESIEYQKLKHALQGESLVPRLKYRQQVADFIQGKKDIVVDKG